MEANIVWDPVRVCLERAEWMRVMARIQSRRTISWRLWALADELVERSAAWRAYLSET